MTRITQTDDCDRESAIEYFEWLDDLRNSGAMNMWGARAALAEEFGLDRSLSTAVHSAWMATFDGKTSAADRAAQAFA